MPFAKETGLLLSLVNERQHSIQHPPAQKETWTCRLEVVLSWCWRGALLQPAPSPDHDPGSCCCQATDHFKLLPPTQVEGPSLGPTAQISHCLCSQMPSPSGKCFCRQAWIPGTLDERGHLIWGEGVCEVHSPRKLFGLLES